MQLPRAVDDDILKEFDHITSILQCSFAELKLVASVNQRHSKNLNLTLGDLLEALSVKIWFWLSYCHLQI